ncbi:MAG: galactose oxidase-like domain-containing protein [Verrucomicrobiota bacterium]
MKPIVLFTVIVGLLAPLRSAAVSITGQISETVSSNGIAGARVTLFTTDLRIFREERTVANGSFRFDYIGSGMYQLGVASSGYEYQETTVTISNAAVALDFGLQPETNGGRWSIVGNTEPELIDGSGSGTLLPTGDIFFCHDTQDPIMFDPVSGLKWLPPNSGSAQGCHMLTLNTDGGMFVAGGSMGGNPQDVVVKTVKTYWRNTNSWQLRPNLITGRWYPGLVRLADERIMILGGELNGASGRTNGCEIFNPASNAWSVTGSFDLPTEIAPALLLFNGEVLKTWRYPEIYNPTNGTWRPAANMIQERRGASFGDHADHELVHLPDGRVMAVGILPLVTNANTRFCEFYSPSNNAWTLGPNPRALRGQPEALILPDGRVLSFGGQYSGPTPAPIPLANAGTIPNCTKVADIYDPSNNTWRALADMNRYIHYHNVTVLAPDGRVIATGGAGLTSFRSFAGDDSSIEAFEPPYLFRGVRPRIDSLSTTDLVLGSNFTVRVSFTAAVTKLVLVSARASTHWVDGGPQRFLSLGFTQNGSLVEATIPNDPPRALAGWYILFAMVDDIPSVGRMVRITPAPVAPLDLPTVNLIADDATAGESGVNTATFRVTRTGVTNAPLTVSYSIAGTAVNGADFNAISNFVVIPAGTNSATVTISPKDDTYAEGDENVRLSIFDNTGYHVGTATNATALILDDEINVPPFRLEMNRAASGQFQLTLNGPASRISDIETSTNFTAWQFLTTLNNITGTTFLTENLGTNRLFFRARHE